jgi:hypothetical protein
MTAVALDCLTGRTPGRDLQFRVADHRVVDMALGLFDVARRLTVAAHRVDTQAGDLAVALTEIGLEAGHIPSLVVQTGVKSFGWENRIAQPLPIHSWKRWRRA